MFDFDPTILDSYYKSKFERYERFLKSKNVPEGAFYVGGPSSAGSPPDPAITIIYDAWHAQRGGPGGLLSWPTPSGQAQVYTDLSIALFVLAFAFDEPANMEWLTSFPADDAPADTCAALGLPVDTLKRAVGQYMPGEYVAPDRNKWVYFLVEPYGEIARIAEGAQAAPVLQMLACGELRTKQNLASRLATFLVPDAPPDSRL